MFHICLLIKEFALLMSECILFSYLILNVEQAFHKTQVLAGGASEAVVMVSARVAAEFHLIIRYNMKRIEN